MSEIKDRFPYHLFLMVLAVFLSVTTVVLAAIPLFLLRNSAGRGLYYIYGFGLCCLLAISQELSFVVPILSSLLLVGFFEEARRLTCSMFQAGLASLLIVTGILSFSLSIFIQFSGLDLKSFLVEKLNVLLSSLKEVQPDMMIEAEKILVQLPSAIVMIFMLTLWLGLVGSSFAARRYKTIANYTSQPNLDIMKSFDGAQFHLPGQLVWLTLPVLAMAFLDFQNQALNAVGNNLLNVIVVMYFFHGLSIIAFFFKEYEVGTFWRWFWYVILVIHMFLLVSSLGFADYWLDFRSKIRKYLAKTNKGSIK